MHYFSYVFDNVLYMFRTGPLSIIRRYSWWWTLDLSETCRVKVKWFHYRPVVAQRVGRGIALLFHDCGTRRGWVVSSTPQPHFTPVKDPVPILQETGWAPGPVWTGGKSRPHRDSIPDRPAHSWATRPTHLEYFMKYIWEIVYLVVFHYKNTSRWTVLWMSNSPNIHYLLFL